MEEQEMEEQANATSTASVAPNNKRRDPSGVETREVKRPRKEKAHDEADSSEHSMIYTRMIGGGTEEEEKVEGEICFLNQVNELKMELKMVTSHLKAEMNRSIEELQKATNEKIQELEKATNEEIQELEAKIIRSTRNFGKRESIKHPWIRHFTFPQALLRWLPSRNQSSAPMYSCQT